MLPFPPTPLFCPMAQPLLMLPKNSAYSGGGREFQRKEIGLGRQLVLSSHILSGFYAGILIGIFKYQTN